MRIKFVCALRWNREKSDTDAVNGKAYVTYTCDRFVALIKTLGRQPLDNEDGGTGSVNAEHQDEAPRRVVVRLCWCDTHDTQHIRLTTTERTTEVANVQVLHSLINSPVKYVDKDKLL